jgi:hypothetical protein
VEDRLPQLIQKRLDAEIQQHPPIFPWETEIDEYDETTEVESGHPNLNIPSPPPELSTDSEV